MAYIEKRIYSGDFLEIEKYWGVLTKNGFRRNKKEKVSKNSQIKLNEKNARINLNRLMLNNFSTSDYFLTLTFADKNNVDEETAKKEIANFFRRVKNYRKKKGLEELKYICVLEKDKKNGFHFHLTINKINLEDLKSLWGKGRLMISNLEINNETGLQGLANYFLKQKLTKVIDKKTGEEIENDCVKNAKRWSQSKNLIKPVIKKEIRKTMNVRKQPEVKGYRMLSFETIDNEYFGIMQYIRYMRI